MPAGFEDMLSAVGWSKAELSRRLGVHRNTVTRWGDNCPAWVLEYLRVCLLAKEIIDG